ncbi:hypothetical protein BY457_12260 [Marinilabilia salmonicolor]|jgi:hypothetical protein|nr:hypothetical protein BY457_12260 [Marinilabilia salmonicolor]
MPYFLFNVNGKSLDVFALLLSLLMFFLRFNHETIGGNKILCLNGIIIF